MSAIYSQLLFSEQRVNSNYKRMAFSCGDILNVILYRTEPLFCRRTKDCYAEPHISLCANATCGVPGALLFMCCCLTAQSSSCDYYGCFWRRTHDGVDTFFLMIIKIFHKTLDK